MLSQICSTHGKKDMAKSKNKTKDMPVTWHEEWPGNKKVASEEKQRSRGQHQESTSKINVTETSKRFSGKKFFN